MGFRFRRSKSFGPFRITASKRGLSYSIGGKGVRLTRRADGSLQETATLPHTGISYVRTVGKRHKPPQRSAQPNIFVALASWIAKVIRELRG